MIDIEGLFKNLDDALSGFPPKIKGELNKFNHDLKKVALSDKPKEQKINEVDFMQKSFMINIKNEFASNK